MPVKETAGQEDDAGKDNRTKHGGSPEGRLRRGKIAATHSRYLHSLFDREGITNSRSKADEIFNSDPHFGRCLGPPKRHDNTNTRRSKRPGPMPLDFPLNLDCKSRIPVTAEAEHILHFLVCALRPGRLLAGLQNRQEINFRG